MDEIEQMNVAPLRQNARLSTTEIVPAKGFDVSSLMVAYFINSEKR